MTFVFSGTLTSRIVWTLFIEVVIFVVTIILAMIDSSNWPGIFFYLTIFSVILLNSEKQLITCAHKANQRIIPFLPPFVFFNLLFELSHRKQAHIYPLPLILAFFLHGNGTQAFQTEKKVRKVFGGIGTRRLLCCSFCWPPPPLSSPLLSEAESLLSLLPRS